MKSKITKAKIPKLLPEEVISRMDAFHDPVVLNAIYGKSWYCFWYKDGKEFFFHVFAAEQYISKKYDLDLYDINPFLGYSGPIVSGENDFIYRALNYYKQSCKDLGIVAELIRFSPIDKNHIAFKDIKELKLIFAKKIIIMQLKENEADQLKSYASSARRRINIGKRNCIISKINKSTSWEDFILLLYDSLKRNKAESKYYMSRLFFEQAKKSQLFDGYGAYKDNKLISCALLLRGKHSNYYLMAGNSELKIKGANELLIHRMATLSQAEGRKSLILGGGLTRNNDDGLYKFKKKFSPINFDFYLGGLIHNNKLYYDALKKAEKLSKNIQKENYFLKYRL